MTSADAKIDRYIISNCLRLVKNQRRCPIRCLFKIITSANAEIKDVFKIKKLLHKIFQIRNKQLDILFTYLQIFFEYELVLNKVTEILAGQYFFQFEIKFSLKNCAITQSINSEKLNAFHKNYG